MTPGRFLMLFIVGFFCATHLDNPNVRNFLVVTCYIGVSSALSIGLVVFIESLGWTKIPMIRHFVYLGLFIGCVLIFGLLGHVVDAFRSVG